MAASRTIQPTVLPFMAIILFSCAILLVARSNVLIHCIYVLINQPTKDDSSSLTHDSSNEQALVNMFFSLAPL